MTTCVTSAVSTAYFPEYAIEMARKRSFSKWPRYMKQKPEQLCDAGFFYSGLGDGVICFSCGGDLNDWDANDEPWEQHALLLSECRYLNLVKGQSYIEKVIAKHKAAKAAGDLSEQFFAASLPEVTDATSASEVQKQTQTVKKPYTSHLRTSEEKLCKMCYTVECNTVFLPCGHVVACAKCVLSVKKCPLCRNPFTDVMRVYSF